MIIDGKTCKACVPDTDSLDGRDSDHGGRSDGMGRTGLYLCIRKGGAVQCGFCIREW